MLSPLWEVFRWAVRWWEAPREVPKTFAFLVWSLAICFLLGCQRGFVVFVRTHCTYYVIV
jgi:hypothetical protein